MSYGLVYPSLKVRLVSGDDFSSLKAAAPSVFQPQALLLRLDSNPQTLIVPNPLTPPLV